MERALSRPASIGARPLGTAFGRDVMSWFGSGLLARALEALMRFGQFARGLVFLVPGAFAMRFAVSRHGTPITQTRTLEMIGEQPFGRVFLVVVSVGLAGYVLWGLVRTLRGPQDVPGLAGNLMLRLGYLTSAIAYGALLVIAVRLVIGGHPRPETATAWVGMLLSKPFGSWLLGICGLIWIGAGGIGQFLSAVHAGFARDLELERMGPAERRWALTLGRIGLGARSLVFAAVGVLIVQAARHIHSDESPDLAGGLHELTRHTFGHSLLFLTALGLIVFGIYAILCARWARVRVARPPSQAPGNASFQS